ncbi:MAG TPA: hypothetical protein VL947_12005, partial [Cytophagales bacterium]|nr:hypothetical protein [Cytophagales bacterium]
MLKTELEFSFDKHLLPTVYEHLLDLRKYGEVHPSIVSVIPLRHINNFTTEYQVEEHFTICNRCVYSPKYKAIIEEVHPHKLVTYRSHIRSNYYLFIDYDFTHKGSDEIFLTEKITVSGNKVVA